MASLRTFRFIVIAAQRKKATKILLSHGSPGASFHHSMEARTHEESCRFQDPRSVYFIKPTDIPLDHIKTAYFSLQKLGAEPLGKMTGVCEKEGYGIPSETTV